MPGKKTVKNSSTAPRHILATERRIQALALRKQGLDYAEIARRVGYSNRGNAYHAVIQELSQLRHEAGDEVLALELARLDALLNAIWPAAMKDKNDAVDKVLRIMQRRARLMGLDKQGTEKTKTESITSVQIKTIVAVMPLGSQSQIAVEEVQSHALLETSQSQAVIELADGDFSSLGESDEDSE